MQAPTIYEFLRDFWAPILATVAGAGLALNPGARNSLIRLFFVKTDAEPARQDRENEVILELRKELDELKAKVDQPVTTEVTETIRKSLDSQLYSHIPDLIRKHLDRLSKDEDLLVRHFETAARQAAHKHLEDLPFTELIESELYREAWDERRKKSEAFTQLLEKQLTSANSTRTVMMNLFVAFNFILMLFFIALPALYSEKASLAVLGVYVSLSAFIIYIYRASNARAASLLSIKEDDKKLYDVFMFLSRFKKGNTYSNNEVEIIKSLMINRFERERGSEHPYEVALKGITNSTVLLRGGKVAATKPKPGE